MYTRRASKVIALFIGAPALVGLLWSTGPQLSLAFGLPINIIWWIEALVIIFILSILLAPPIRRHA